MQEHADATPSGSTPSEPQLPLTNTANESASTPRKEKGQRNVAKKSDSNPMEGPSQVDSSANNEDVDTTKTKKVAKKGFKVPKLQKDDSGDGEPPTAPKRARRGRPKKY